MWNPGPASIRSLVCECYRAAVTSRAAMRQNIFLNASANERRLLIMHISEM